MKITFLGNIAKDFRITERLELWDDNISQRNKFSFLPHGALWYNHSTYVNYFAKIRQKLLNLHKNSIVEIGYKIDCIQNTKECRDIILKTIRLLCKLRIHHVLITSNPTIASPKFLESMDKTYSHIHLRVKENDSLIANNTTKPTKDYLTTYRILEGNGFDVSLRLVVNLGCVDVDKVNKLEGKKILIEFPSKSDVQELLMDDYSVIFDEEFIDEHYFDDEYSFEDKLEFLGKLTTKELSVFDVTLECHDYCSEYINYNPFDCYNLHIFNGGKYIGNLALLHMEKSAFLSSQKSFKETQQSAVAWAKEQAENGKCVISGFQSKTEQLVLNELLKHKTSKIIMVLATAMPYHLPKNQGEAIAEGRMMIMAPVTQDRLTLIKINAHTRNEYVIRHAQKIVVGDVTPNGMTAQLISGMDYLKLGKSESK